MNEEIGYEEFDRRRPGFFSRLFGTYQKQVISAQLMFDAEYYYIKLTVKKYKVFTPEWYISCTNYKINESFMGEDFLQTWRTPNIEAAERKLHNVKLAVKFITY